MIREKDLKPGTVLTHMVRRWDSYMADDTCVITTWMVVGIIEQVIKRRHSKASAHREGFRVALLRLGKGDDSDVLTEVLFSEYVMRTDWKRLA